MQHSWWQRWARFLLFMGAMFLWGCEAGVDSTYPKETTRLPDVSLSGLGDETATSTTALIGSPLIINFWATWCEPCRREMPGLERLSGRLAAQGVRLIGVTVDTDLNLAREFVRARDLTFPIYVDAGTNRLRALLRIHALPASVLVSADGTVRAHISGAREWDGAEGLDLIRQAFGIRLEAAN